VDVEQTDGRLVARGVDPAPPVGFTVLEKSETTGNVNRDGSFILNKTVRARVDEYEVEVMIYYTASGTFTSSGWSGDYTYQMFLAGESGTARAVFSGERY